MPDDCPFCSIVHGDREAWIVHETETALAFFSKGPAAPYHTLVIPKRHHADAFDIPADEWLGVAGAVKDVVDLYGQRLGITDVEILNCSGEHAQQAISHLHVHVVPRHEGDGQNTHWTEYPEMRERFDALLRDLRA